MAPPTESPIPYIEFSGGEPVGRSLVVMLPGRGDRAETFAREGFQEAGKRHGFDTILVDAHFGYYRKRSLIPRLHEDIILPAREAGYERVWLLGVSLGGFGSVLYAADHPGEIDGVILLAPYLGEEEVIDEIRQSGGLGAWDPNQSDLEAHEIALWSWLQEVTDENPEVPLILGYGLSDSLASTYEVLLPRLPSSAVYTVDGGHGWQSWRPLWEEISAATDL